MNRRHTLVLITAARGDVRAARGLAGRAIREAFGIARWNAAPHAVSYDPCDGDPRFTLDATAEEADALTAALRRLARADGWTCTPAEVYQT